VSALDFEYHHGGLHLPRLGLWLDAPSARPEPVFVSHAHSDHTARHREVILSKPTARLMGARLGGKRIEHTLEFGEPCRFQFGGKEEFQFTLLPAGHIFGSAMAFIECAGQSLLYTGDFKLRRSLSAEVCQPRRADVLVMETTFGRAKYQFPAAETVIADVVRFCGDALREGSAAVLHAYSLGKSQELLHALRDAALPLVLHPAVFAMTKVYEEFGHRFPAHERHEGGDLRGKVLISPPNVPPPDLRARRAILSGWAMDPGCKYQSGCDAAFPFSDHADFPELVEFVRRVQPRTVFTLHGFAAEFAATLRSLGRDARALSEEDQLELALPGMAPVVPPFVEDIAPRRGFN
jgi:Cft2 family RNA processing exonuclease